MPAGESILAPRRTSRHYSLAEIQSRRVSVQRCRLPIPLTPCPSSSKSDCISATRSLVRQPIWSDDSDMPWPFKSKPSRAAFSIGAYKLGDLVDTAGLTEFSTMEYQVMSRQFKRERNFHAPPVTFLGRTWNSCWAQSTAEFTKSRHTLSSGASRSKPGCHGRVGILHRTTRQHRLSPNGPFHLGHG